MTSKIYEDWRRYSLLRKSLAYRMLGGVSTEQYRQLDVHSRRA